MGKESTKARLTQLEEWLKTTKNYKNKAARRNRAIKNNRQRSW